MSQHAIILVRPPPVRGESWGGYLRFVASANGFDNFQPLARVAEVKAPWLLKGNPSETMLALGFEGSAIPAERDLGHLRLTVRARRKWCRRHTTFKYCPDCLRAGQRAPSWWDNTFAILCPEHDGLLLDHCRQCQSVLEHAQASWTHCVCGFSFQDAEHSTPAAWQKAMALFLHRPRHDRRDTFAALDDEEYWGGEHLKYLLAQLRSPSLQACFERYWEIGISLGKHLRDHPSKSREIQMMGGDTFPLLGHLLYGAVGCRDEEDRAALRAEEQAERSNAIIARRQRVRTRHG